MRIDFAFKVHDCWAIVTDTAWPCDSIQQLGAVDNWHIQFSEIEFQSIKIKSVELGLRNGVSYIGFRLDPATSCDLKSVEGTQIHILMT